jgi:hypothetical protein
MSVNSYQTTRHSKKCILHSRPVRTSILIYIYSLNSSFKIFLSTEASVRNIPLVTLEIIFFRSSPPARCLVYGLHVIQQHNSWRIFCRNAHTASFAVNRTMSYVTHTTQRWCLVDTCNVKDMDAALTIEALYWLALEKVLGNIAGGLA